MPKNMPTSMYLALQPPSVLYFLFLLDVTVLCRLLKWLRHSLSLMIESENCYYLKIPVGLN